MDDPRLVRRGLAALLCWGVLFLSPAHAATDKIDLLHQAEQLEQKGHWAEAADKYEVIPPRERSGDVRSRYLFCLRHVHLQQRHNDATYQQEALTLDLTTAVRAYGEVLGKLQGTYVDSKRAEIGRLFHEGMEELRLSLNDDAFRQEYLPATAPESIRAFIVRMGPTWGNQPVRHRKDAERLVRDVALAAQQALSLRAAIVVLEFASGACNNLDEYTYYLTPRQLDETYASFKGEQVGVGISDVAAEGEKLLVKNVMPGSPAGREGIQVDDRILRIDQKPVESLSAESALEKLRGEPGTTVQLQVWIAATRQTRTLVLTREAVLIPSVSPPQCLEPGIGYLQLTGFQETTVEEMQKAIQDLQLQGMKVLILDLRGNPGGLFEAAIQIAERFLAEGVIVATHGQAESQNRTYQAGNASAVSIPLIVLIDGDTASAAEVVAGALKENHRATLVGQTTYGKGSVQCVVKLDTLPAGIRITLAKFFSPLGHAYQPGGVTPHIVVAQTPATFDNQRQAAVLEARQLLPIRR